MILRCLALVLTGLAAPAALAQDSDAVAAMTKAIEDAGCVVTAENGDSVLADSGLDEQATMDVIAVLYEDGLVALQADGTMKLTNEACQ